MCSSHSNSCCRVHHEQAHTWSSAWTSNTFSRLSWICYKFPFSFFSCPPALVNSCISASTLDEVPLWNLSIEDILKLQSMSSHPFSYGRLRHKQSQLLSPRPVSLQRINLNPVVLHPEPCPKRHATDSFRPSVPSPSSVSLCLSLTCVLMSSAARQFAIKAQNARCTLTPAEPA
jgi:hypothetical protein